MEPVDALAEEARVSARAIEERDRALLDTARLDWLEAQFPKALFLLHNLMRNGMTLRDAIDRVAAEWAALKRERAARRGAKE